MKYLILAVLLAVMPASPPIPWQAPNRPRSTGRNNQKQTQTKETPPAPSSANINEDQSETADGNRNEQANQNAGNPVVVSKLPPVTVLAAKRDWFDRLYWGFGALLALTGILQIFLLFRTIKIYREQRDQMVQAREQTERIITQMKDTEVRDLRAYVGVSKAILVVQSIWQPTAVVEFQNFGKTPAYNVRQWIGVAVYSHPLTVALPESSNPSTASVLTLYPGTKTVLRTTLKKELPHTGKVGTHELTVYAYGGVTYKDIFGNHLHTNYRFIFGGPEGGGFYRDDGGILCGIMGPDSEGNDAT